MATSLQYGEEHTLDIPREYAPARTLARLFFATFWLVIFTGAIRKWMFPNATILYILQDIPIAMAYAYAFSKGIFDRGMLLAGILLLSVILTLQGLLQIIVSGLNPFVFAVGLHNYLFYLPMLVVFPVCLTEKHRRNFVRWYLLSSIPMCVLAIAQAESPLTAFINHTTEGDAFGVPGADVARVSGTFNFVLFYALWVGIGVALNLGEWLMPRERRVIQRRWLLIVCTVSINLCHLVSASRLAISNAAVAILGGVICAVAVRSVRAIAVILGILLMLPLVAGVTYLISPNEANIIVERFTGKGYQQEGLSRVEQTLDGFLTEPPLSLIGAGIGVGVDAAHVGSVDAYNYTYQLSEEDTIRNVMELGTVVGLLYIAVRIGFLFGIVFLAFRIVRSGSSPHVLPLAIFIATDGYIGDLTRSATMTATQVMIGCCFILSAYFHPDHAAVTDAAIDPQLVRYA
ncbi:hypothetical protein ACFPT7_02715 [Acidicapsa dinghuensis]|uniref:O-antigen ligase domain-containing protein n=1 Tax=Acidicapsa dinghuensis TaxID=2218256 RepID=A0ABW1EA34_9BACT|nr:hypothetical protein [Acidicapsa dinghuensis]